MSNLRAVSLAATTWEARIGQRRLRRLLKLVCPRLFSHARQNSQAGQSSLLSGLSNLPAPTELCRCKGNVILLAAQEVAEKHRDSPLRPHARQCKCLTRRRVYLVQMRVALLWIFNCNEPARDYGSIEHMDW